MLNILIEEFYKIIPPFSICTLLVFFALALFDFLSLGAMNFSLNNQVQHKKAIQHHNSHLSNTMSTWNTLNNQLGCQREIPVIYHTPG